MDNDDFDENDYDPLDYDHDGDVDSDDFIHFATNRFDHDHDGDVDSDDFIHFATKAAIKRGSRSFRGGNNGGNSIDYGFPVYERESRKQKFTKSTNNDYERVQREKAFAEKEKQRRKADEKSRIKQEKAEKAEVKRERFWGTLTGKKVKVGISPDYYHGKLYESIEKYFRSQGFFNISVNKTEDLPYEKRAEDSRVSSVSIDGVLDYTEDSIFPAKADVIIYTHTMMKARAPYTTKTGEGLGYAQVVYSFKQAGFKNVIGKPVKAGFLKKNDTVARILIDGNEDIKSKEAYRVDSDVVVEYYTQLC